MSFPSKCLLTKHSLALSVTEDKKKSLAEQQYDRLEKGAFNDPSKTKIYGFAKLVYEYQCNNQSSIKNYLKYRVRVIQIDFSPDQYKDFLKGKIENNVKIRSSISKKINIPENLGKFVQTIQETIENIQLRKKALVRPQELEQKLRKLMYYVVSLEEWPFQKQENSIDNIIAVFEKFKKADLTIPNQTAFLSYIQKVKRKVHEHSMDLEEINIKIATKAMRDSPGNISQLNRMKELLKLGTERIFWPERKQHEAVMNFGRVFALHTYAYRPDADNAASRQVLNTAVDRFSELLVAYDKKNSSEILADIFTKLLIDMAEYAKGNEPLDKATFSRLAWTLESLVSNNRIVAYLQPFVKENKKLGEPLAILFSHELTWRMIIRFVLALGDRSLFQQILMSQIDPKTKTLHLNQRQIELIFICLNDSLSQAHSLFKEEYKAMYLELLAQLARANKLHFLVPYALHEKHLAQLKENFHTKLGLEYVDGAEVPLATFFGNGTYRAISENGLAMGMNVKKALVRLFSRYRENPISDEKSFQNALVAILTDFSTTFDKLCEVVIGQIGESAPPGIDKNNKDALIPVETWLAEKAKPIYDSLKTYVLMCLPHKWEEERFNGAKNLYQRICLHNDKLYLIDQDEQGNEILKDFFTNEIFKEKPEMILVSELPEEAKVQLRADMDIKENQTAVAALTTAYMAFHNHQRIKMDLEQLLNILFKRMKAGDNQVSFKDRVNILAGFLHVMAPFFKKLDKLVEERFFVNGKLKSQTVVNLVEAAKKVSGTDISQTLLDLTPDADVAFSPQMVPNLSHLISALCVKDIEEVLTKCSLHQLTEITSQFEYIVSRRLDELSYRKEEFIASFSTDEVNTKGLSTQVLGQILGDLAIKDKIIADYGQYLKERPIPIRFILPNQAIAIALTTSDNPAIKDRNLLIKLGTGQGKSLAIALTAVNEAKKILKTPKGRVFVFTSYDHLARRDHAFGEFFFKKDKIGSLCISQIGDVSSFNDSTKIVYADIEIVEEICRQINLKLLENKATPAEVSFLDDIYEMGENTRVILDEYDLLAYDLNLKEPFVQVIPNSLLDAKYVQNNNNLWPYLSSLTQLGKVDYTTKSAIDPSSGKEYSNVGWYNPTTKTFNLAPSVLRLSCQLRKAKRVIGFSGTSLEGEQHGLNDPLFFKIPSSQNPLVFGTMIEGIGTYPPGAVPNIKLRKKINFDIVRKEKDNNGDEIHVLTEGNVAAYCEAVVSDIKEARAAIQTESESYERPVLSFGDPYFKYKTTTDPQVKSLWDTLQKAIKAAQLPLDIVTKDVSDEDLQKIALSKANTLTTIKYGRGADIRVSLDITEGLHVLVGTAVRHQRLLTQSISRTGRMGRNGTYSIITFGSETLPSTDEKNASEFYDALHTLSQQFIKRVIAGGVSDNDKKNWLIMFGSAFSTRNSTQKINKAYLKQLCGNFFNESAIPAKFFS